MPEFVAAIDLGTTGIKACVFRDDGALVGNAYQEISIRFPEPGLVEQDAAEIWETTGEVVKRALEAASLKASGLKAVGVASQRSSIMAWNDRGEPLSPLIGWQDTRTRERCAELMGEGFYITPMMAASKAEWIIKDLEGRGLRDGARLGTPDSWLAAKLCGVHVTDHSNASSTGLYDHFQAGWDQALMGALGLEADLLPEIVDSSTVVGTTDGDALGAELPLAAMVADQQASLFGLRCTDEQRAKVSYGTSASVNMATGPQVSVGGPGTFPLVAWSVGGERTYCIEGQVITAGAAVQWLRDGLGVVKELSEVEALASAGVDEGVWVIPAFQGLGTPAAKPEARAVIGGLSGGTRAADIARAMIDGVAHRIADAAESVWEARSAPPDSVRADGGASVNDLLLQRQADLLGIPVERSSVSDGGALGAAMMAGLATRVWADAAELDGLWKCERTFAPRLSEDERLERRAVWKQRLQKVIDSDL